MRRILLVSVLCLLGLGASQAQQAPTPAPANLIARAVSLVVACSYDVSAAEEKNGKPKAASLSKGESEMKSKVSLPILLRPDRYVYPSVTDGSYNGRSVWTIHFEPATAGQPAARPGEDERLNRAMNNMAGDIRVDKATGGIIRLDAILKGTMFFPGTVRFLGIPTPVTVTVFSGNLRVDQKLVNGIWTPELATLETWVVASWLIFPVPAHYTYTAPFNCGK